jgi:hypothetical protein
MSTNKASNTNTKGGEATWSYLLAFPIVPALLGGITLLLFFPESPKALIMCNNDTEAAQRALQQLRGKQNVREELELIANEKKESGGGDKQQLITMKELFTLDELRWPLITALVLQTVQQLSGINAVFFYSSSIFAGAGIPEHNIQYAILSTGIVNVFATIVCVSLIDKLGRKPLLVSSMFIMLVDFILLTIFLSLQARNIPFHSIIDILNAMLLIYCFSSLKISN